MVQSAGCFLMSNLRKFSDKDSIFTLTSNLHEANQNGSLHSSLMSDDGSTLTWEDTQLQLVSQNTKLLSDFQHFKYANCMSGF